MRKASDIGFTCQKAEGIRYLLYLSENREKCPRAFSLLYRHYIVSMNKEKQEQMKNSSLYYSVGPLLYSPANSESLCGSLIHQMFGTGYSLALCLEDTIQDSWVQAAENTLIHTLTALHKEKRSSDFFLPKIFIRVRNPQQIKSLLDRLGDACGLAAGFILPKFSEDNADEYLKQIEDVNKMYGRDIFAMPILESPSIINLKDRYRILYSLKEKLDDVERLILNVRVGGNDLCHAFGIRRRADECIHDISPVADIFSDIITIYGMDYVVSGPVWEYYSGDGWKTGLIEELKRDRLCGFIGKTVIHPKQIEIVRKAYCVPQKDLDDAKAILNWDDSSKTLVSGNPSKERMNELNTHSNWALRTILLAEAYGVKTE